ncbi:MAG TPA: hypothetical protein VGM88_16955 [Kofleriaceae bacterium]|jgi:hypothetical protein
MSVHRFRPRYRTLALGASGAGGAVAVLGAIAGPAALPIVTGALGVVLGIAYLRSSIWKLAITADATGLAVGAPGAQPKFTIAWGDIVRVTASPSTKTCHVNGGDAGKSFLVPGPGATAAYSIEDRETLFDAILAHTPKDRVKIVDTIERAS